MAGWHGDPGMAMMAPGASLSSSGAGIGSNLSVGRRLDLGGKKCPGGPPALRNKPGMLTSLPDGRQPPLCTCLKLSLPPSPSPIVWRPKLLQDRLMCSERKGLAGP